jgi:chromosome segregation ATPase
MLYANMGGNGDLQRAQGQLDQVEASSKPDAERLKPLAGLLSAMLADRRRQDDNADRLTQQLHDEQRRAEQLNDKLEALKNIERTLQTRPYAPAGSLPEAGNPPGAN